MQKIGLSKRLDPTYTTAIECCSGGTVEGAPTSRTLWMRVWLLSIQYGLGIYMIYMVRSFAGWDGVARISPLGHRTRSEVPCLVIFRVYNCATVLLRSAYLASKTGYLHYTPFNITLAQMSVVTSSRRYDYAPQRKLQWALLARDSIRCVSNIRAQAMIIRQLLSPSPETGRYVLRSRAD
jgi:hypothetical protein